MTTGGLLVVVVGCIVWAIFGIYAGTHLEDKDSKKDKHTHA